MAKDTKVVVRRPPSVLMTSIEKRIYMVRGQKVLLDWDLAALYRVSTGALNQAVRRNKMRFPEDFMFQLTPEETGILRSQSVISRWGGRRYLAFAFTEQGVAMLSSVLKSERAILVNVAIMRTFVKLRQLVATHQELANKIEELERKFRSHDKKIGIVFAAIKKLLEPPTRPRKPPIGFKT